MLPGGFVGKLLGLLLGQRHDLKCMAIVDYILVSNALFEVEEDRVKALQLLLDHPGKEVFAENFVLLFNRGGTRTEVALTPSAEVDIVLICGCNWFMYRVHWGDQIPFFSCILHGTGKVQISLV